MYIKTHRTCPVIERSKEDTFAVFCGVLQNSRILGVVHQCMCICLLCMGCTVSTKDFRETGSHGVNTAESFQIKAQSSLAGLSQINCMNKVMNITKQGKNHQWEDKPLQRFFYTVSNRKRKYFEQNTEEHLNKSTESLLELSLKVMKNTSSSSCFQ